MVTLKLIDTSNYQETQLNRFLKLAGSKSEGESEAKGTLQLIESTNAKIAQM